MGPVRFPFVTNEIKKFLSSSSDPLQRYWLCDQEKSSSTERKGNRKEEVRLIIRFYCIVEEEMLADWWNDGKVKDKCFQADDIGDWKPIYSRWLYIVAKIRERPESSLF